MNSGLDTEKLVKDLMKIEQTKLDRELKQKQLLEWKRSDYRSINTKLLSLRNAAFDLKLSSAFSAKTVSSSEETRVTATANANSIAGEYSIEIKQLAKGVTIENNYGTDTGIVDDALQAGGSLKINGVTVELSAGDTVAAVASKINAQSKDTGVKATYDTNTNLFYLMSTSTGADQKVEITESTYSDVSFLANQSRADGANAQISFNGGSTVEFSSNQFTFNNITFNLKKAEVDTTVQISVSNDVDSTVEKIKSFIEAYNSVMAAIDGEITEERDRDYEPLTDAQKDEMSDTEIEKWEAKASAGMLSSDSLLKSVYSKIRGETMDKVDGSSSKYTSLSSLGITTAGWFDQGKLYLDENKLREALVADPEGVQKLFTADAEKDGFDGIAQKLYDAVDNGMERIQDKAGSSSSLLDQSYLGKEIDRIDERIEKLEDYLVNVEERYWNKFTAMETALQQMQSQSSWLSSMLGTNS